MGRLQQELKQRKPFQSVAQEALLGLMRTTDLMRRQVAAFVEPHGITLQQYNVLRILRGGGTDGVPTLEVAERMVEQTPGITRLLDRLEAKGFVSGSGVRRIAASISAGSRPRAPRCSRSSTSR